MTLAARPAAKHLKLMLSQQRNSKLPLVPILIEDVIALTQAKRLVSSAMKTKIRPPSFDGERYLSFFCGSLEMLPRLMNEWASSGH